MNENKLICPKCGQTNIGDHVHACAHCGEDLFYVEEKFTFPLKLIMWLSFGVGLLYLFASLAIIFGYPDYKLISLAYFPGTINLVIGWGIWKRKYWARGLAIAIWTIIIIASLFGLSLLETALGLFIIYTLQTPEARMFFRNKKSTQQVG